MSAERERDEAKEEAHLARLAVVAAGDTKVLVEDKLARVQDALVVAEEARRKAKAEAAHLAKDEVYFLHSQAGRTKRS